jgi:hypothetical protein
MLRILLLAVFALALPAAAQLPRGWELHTTTPRLFQASRETGSAAAGKASGLLIGQDEANSHKYALLLQKISATDYRGRRVRLSAKLRAQAVPGRTGLFLRADSGDGEPVAFDNMEDRPIKGDQSWTAVSLDIDIPAEAKEIHFGLLLCGAGRAGIDDVSLTVLAESRPVAKAVSRIRSLPRAPVNGDFER